jgi:hypothetical protein
VSGQPNGFADDVECIWIVADLLRGDLKAHEYGQVILPFTALRRMECALASTKAKGVARAPGLTSGVDAILLRTVGHAFYNVSPLDHTMLLNDPGEVASNLRTYLARFNPGAREVLDAYEFEDKTARLNKAELLYQVVTKFAELDLTETAVFNDAMGHIFEELLRRFSEMSNDTAGEHFTPRDGIKLMVNVLFASDDDALRGEKPVRPLYDRACGTGGMLSVVQDRPRELNARTERHRNCLGRRTMTSVSPPLFPRVLGPTSDGSAVPTCPRSWRCCARIPHNRRDGSGGSGPNRRLGTKSVGAIAWSSCRGPRPRVAAASPAAREGLRQVPAPRSTRVPEVAELMRAHPDCSGRRLARELGRSHCHVQTLARKARAREDAGDEERA